MQHRLWGDELMSKRRMGIKNPDEDPNASALDAVRRFTGGETPAERIARVEKEYRDPAIRILERLEGKRVGRKRRPGKT